MAITRSGIPIDELDPRQALYELMAYHQELESRNLELQTTKEELVRQNIELELAKVQNGMLLDKYSTLYNQSPSGYLTLSTEGRIVEFNVTSLDFLEKEPCADLKGSLFSDFISKETINEYQDFFGRIFESHEKVSCEIIISGPSKVMYVHLEGITSSDNQTCFVTLVDITQLKETEKALQLSRKAFQSYFENGSVGMSVFSPDRGWLELNQRLCRMFGYTKKELIGKNWIELSHPDDLESNMRLYRQAVDGEIDRYQMDKRFIRKDGSLLYATISVSVQRTEDGSIDHLLSSYVDITESKMAETALKKSEEKYRELIEFAPVAFFQGDQSGNYLMVNDKACEFTGYSREELIKLNMSDLFSKKQLQDKPLRYDLLDSGKIITAERELLRKNGKIIYIEMSSRKMPDGTYQCWMKDITKRKMAEEELRENERRYRFIAENTADVVWIFDLETMRTKYISPSIEKLRGFTPEEIIALDFKDGLTKESYDYVMSSIKKRISDYQKGVNETYIDQIFQKCKDGSVVLTEASTRLMKDEETGHLEILGVSRNISKRNHT